MNIFIKLFLKITTTLFLFAYCINVFAEYGINFPEPVTDNARDIYDIHMNTVRIISALLIVVFSIVIYSIIFHRKSVGYKADQEFHKGVFGRWSWVLVPVLVLGVDLGIAGKAERVLENLWLIPKDENMMDVKVIGHQWWWEYEYIDHGVTVESRYIPKKSSDDLYLRDVDNRLVLPTNTKIRFLHTSADVIHSFWVPQLGMKKDAIAGYITETWADINKEGIYRGQCAEICGAWHARMPIVIEAVDREKFNDWVTQQKNIMLAKAEEASSNREWSIDELMEKGRAVYNKHCSACHQLEGEGLEPAFPALDGSAIVNGPTSEMIMLVLNGKNMMPAWKDILNDTDIGAAMTYTRNSWGNTVKDVVQPADVKATR